MNIYFLVEGKHTEMKVYPKWLSILLPTLTQVKHLFEVKENNYLFFSGQGYPSLLDVHLANCIEDICNVGNFDYLVICLDADDETVENRRQEVINRVQNHTIGLPTHTKLEVIVQNKCIETWFLGNEKIFKQNPAHTFLQNYVAFYNVKKNDPELMDKPNDFDASVALFHVVYLEALLAERNAYYSKNNPYIVTENSFLEQLVKRTKNTAHLQSFDAFLAFCETIKEKMSFGY
ncbi:MAG: hypothetical protein EAZ95_01165 [Bacteroidetes bacterium]|nr:MAG: hypothetical protein EAZ95_01165 [Bacteroidota bacterium]